MNKQKNKKTEYYQSRRLRLIFMAIALCLVVVMTASACRMSPVLVEEVYKSIENPIQEEEEQLEPEDEGQEDDRFENETRDEAEKERSAEEDVGRNDQQNQNQANNSANVNTNQNSNNSGSNSNSQNQNNTSQETPTQPGGSEDGDGENEDENGSGGGSNNEPSADVDAGQKYAATGILDARNANVYIPENIEHVAAVGGAAQFVEMIGGPGKLYATDSVLKESSIANSTFSDLGSAITAFSAYSCTDFNALISAIESDSLDVIFIISDDTRLSSDQIATLEGYAYGEEYSEGEHHVALIYLYSMLSLDGLKGNALIMDEVFSKSDTSGAPSTGAAYVTWVNNIINSVSGYSEKSGLYVAGWDYGAEYTLLQGGTYGFDTSGYGVAYGYTYRKKDQILTSLMEQVNVINSSTGWSGSRVLVNAEIISDYAYIAPLFKDLEGKITPGESNIYFYDYNNTDMYAYGWTRQFEPSVQRRIQEGVYHVLGLANFPAVITANNSVKTEIESNLFWRNYPASNGEISPYGQDSIYQIIQGDYVIYVNPAGMLDWCEGGSVEAPLEMLFIAYAYQGGSDITSDVADFYSTYFGVSNAGSIASTIMAGN